MRFLRPFVDARSEIGGFEVCQRSWGPGGEVVGVVGEQIMDCLRCVGRVGRRRAEIAGRFAAGHGGLAAQLHKRAQIA
jgi:hypothetical protein